MLALLKQLHGEGRTIILITHDLDIARHAERIVRLRDGRVESDSGPVAHAPAPLLARPPSGQPACAPSWANR